MSKKPKYLDRRAKIVNTEVTCWFSCRHRYGEEFEESEMVVKMCKSKQYRQGNTMVKRKSTKGKITIYNTIKTVHLLQT
jgi:hypothetical protein